MTLALAHWESRRLLRLWGAGLLLEAALLLPMFALLVRPEPPLVERLQGRVPGQGQTVAFQVDSTRSGAAALPSIAVPPWPVEEDSFYTVLHWPLNRPLLDGGGRVIGIPMRRWWVPALYVGAVPLGLLVITGAWLLARALGPSRR